MANRDWNRAKRRKPTEEQGDAQLRSLPIWPRLPEQNRQKLRAKLELAVQSFLEKGGKIKRV